METDKKNYATIIFTKDEHKDELLHILNDSRIQTIMPENIRGKASKMLLWMARYIKCQLELGLLDEYQKPVTIDDIGALYYRLKRNYDTWEADLCVLEGLIKQYVEENHLSDTNYPCQFTEEIKDGKIMLHLELSLPEFNFGALIALLHKLEMGEFTSIMTVISDNHVHLSWNITDTRAYASALREWEGVHKSFEDEGVTSEEVDPEFPEEDPPGGDVVSELEIIKSESSSISDVVPPNTKDMEHINADEDKHNQIICLYNEDYSISQLSELYSISCQDIRKIIYLNVNQVLSNLIKKGTDSATNHPDIKDFEEISKTIGKTFGKIVLPVSYQEKQKMIKLYNDGYSISEISKILMRSKTTVSSVLRKNDNEIRITTQMRKMSCPWPKEKEEQIIEDYLTGQKNSYIESKWGISQRTLYRILRDHNIELRKIRKD